MLVGATGSGKSTLVDGIVNFVMGVSFDDPFRFTLVQLEEEEKKTHNQVIIFQGQFKRFKLPQSLRRSFIWASFIVLSLRSVY